MFCFLIIDGLFFNNTEQVKEFNTLLMEKLVKRDSIYGDDLLPKYFFTPPENIDTEKVEPHSTPKVASSAGSDYKNMYLMGQAMLIMTKLLLSGLLNINELDPVRRYMPSYSRPKKTGRYSAFQVTFYLFTSLLIHLNFVNVILLELLLTKLPSFIA